MIVKIGWNFSPFLADFFSFGISANAIMFNTNLERFFRPQNYFLNRNFQVFWSKKLKMNEGADLYLYLYDDIWLKERYNESKFGQTLTETS